MKRRPTILLSNDDGINGRGLRPLLAQLKHIGHVVVVVPDRGKSASSHSITLYKPLRVEEVEKDLFTANGTPSDCVRFGILGLCKGKLDLVVSGINEGANLGDDIVYSGTVAAAMEGALLDVPAFAISLAVDQNKKFDFAAKFAGRLSRELLRKGLPRGVFLNVNIPDVPLSQMRGVEITRMGKRFYGNEVKKITDPRGENYYWIKGDTLSGAADEGTDIGAIQRKKVSLTPLRLDLTAYDAMKTIKDFRLPIR